MHKILLNSLRFQQCYYFKAGNGPLVMLVHGFGEHSGIFKHQITSLENNFTVLVPDLPGSGFSTLPNELMSMELLADYLYEIVMQEANPQVIMLGHSMGGYATLAFVAKYENKLSAFGLIHSSAFEDDEAKKENRRKSIKLIQNNGKEVFLKAMIPNLYSQQSTITKQEALHFHLSMALTLSSESLAAYYTAMINRVDTTTQLKNTKLPVLFVIGKEDQAIPYKDALQQSLMPHVSSVELLEDIGHTSMLECPEKLNVILNKFCKYVLDNKIA